MAFTFRRRWEPSLLSFLSIGLSTLAQTRTIETPEDAASVLALLDEAIALGMTIGDRHGVSVSVQNKASVDLATAAGPALLEGLGEQRLVALRDRGSALENAELVAYLRAEADRVLAEVPASSPPHG